MMYFPEVIILGGGVTHHEGLLDMVSEEVKATPHNTTPTKENILGVEEGQGCPLRVFAMTN